MYHSHYDRILPMFTEDGGTVELGGTDTDSFMLTTTHPGVEGVMWMNRDFFDLSKYPQTHKLYIKENGKVVGRFKNECAGCIISDRANLKRKLCAFQTFDPENQASISDMKRCNGVKRSVVAKTLKFSDYTRCLLSQKGHFANQTQLRSFNHDIYTTESRKKAMRAYDDNRFILPAGVHTRAHGH